jgi:CSLREA domain-containing protein
MNTFRILALLAVLSGLVGMPGSAAAPPSDAAPPPVPPTATGDQTQAPDQAEIHARYQELLDQVIQAAATTNDDDTAAAACVTALSEELIASQIAAIAIPPPFDLAPTLAAYAADVGLKYCIPILQLGSPPPDLEVGASNCTVSPAQSVRQIEYGNLLGAPVPPSTGFHRSGDWGFFNRPYVYHFNTQVRLQLTLDGKPVPDGESLSLTPGAHSYAWVADSLISPLDYVPVYVPAKGPLLEYKSLRFAAAASLNLIKSGSKSLWLQPEPHGVQRSKDGEFWVFDTTPPNISLIGPDVVTIEANLPGGARRTSSSADVAATDNCGDPIVDVHAPVFWPVGQTIDVEFVARDFGPRNRSGGNNSSSVHQSVIVQDTQPPILVAPPSVVTETTTLPATIHLGQPLVFDVADLNPTITENALSQPGVSNGPDGLQFPTGLTTVTWSAEDFSGNVSTATQTVNVKPLGANLAPVADALGASAISYEPVTLTLTSSDPDGDPLWFHIDAPPGGGFFVNPLQPYFIEDYRVENFSTLDDLRQACADQGYSGRLVLDYPWQADYVNVADDGTTLVMDNGWATCIPDTTTAVSLSRRLAIFDAHGALVGEVNYAGDSPESVYVDQPRDLIYFANTDLGTLNVVDKYDMDLNRLARYDLQFAGGPTPSMQPRNAVADGAGILYVTNGFQVRLYDSQQVDGNDAPAYLGMLDFGEPVDVYDMALDGTGNLYVSSRDLSRVYKFTPSAYDAAGSFQIGQLVGWLGKCDQDTGDGFETYCDEAEQRSIGYTCTADTCTVTNPVGSEPGQFSTPMGIAVDPFDNLYVTDLDNLRVQRFTPDGYYAGQAQSTDDGTSFVLGDFGEPRDITVNSTHFYILDRTANLLHVSETTPVLPIGDDAAQVVYRSNNNFVGADTFSFVSTDGLDWSLPATVTVDVARNHRPPLAHEGLVIHTEEDVPYEIRLSGSDPDIPLDTLAVIIDNPPNNGSLEPSGDNFIYTPEPDFFGYDQFYYSVTDGTFTSRPVRVEVYVTEVNDAPALSATAARQAGLGYQTLFTATLADPDIRELHRLTVDWGDGVVESEGPITATQPFSGPVLLESIDGDGSIWGMHTYTQTGDYAIEFCATDRMAWVDGEKQPTAESLTGCASTMVQVGAMADGALMLHESANPISADGALQYTLSVIDRPPDDPGAASLATQGTLLTGTLDSRLNFAGVSGELASTCTQAGSTLTCPLGTLAPGVSTTLTLSVTLDAGVEPGAELQSYFRLSHDQPDYNANGVGPSAIGVTYPADYVVDSRNDAVDADPGDGLCATSSGDCTLRAAIREANEQPGPQTIALANGIYRMDLEGDDDYTHSGDFDVRDDLTLIGLDPTITIIDGFERDRLFEVHNDATFTLTNVSLSRALTSDNGGAIAVHGGRLLLENVWLSGNKGHQGGGVSNDGGEVVIRDSAITHNEAENSGGGLANIRGTMTLENVTLSNNVAANNGGALQNSGGFTVTLTNVTVAENTAAHGGGLRNYGTLALHNTLIGGNESPDGADCLGTLVSQGHNLVQETTGCTLSGPGTADLIGQDPLLEGLFASERHTAIHNPQPGSPAIDAGECTLPADQHGTPRPQGDGCDIGAVEYAPVIATAGVAATVLAAGEASGSASVQVTLDQPLLTSASVGYTTEDGSATAGEDYEMVSGTLTFAPGVTNAAFEIQILDDDQPEGAETVIIQLTDPQGPLVLGDDRAVLTIQDDDTAKERTYPVYLPVVIR